MKKARKKALILGWVFAIPTFILSQASFWGFSAHAEDSTGSTNSTTTTETSVIDKSAVDDTKSSISDIQKKIDKAQKKAEKLQQNLGQINQQVTATNKQINQTQTVLVETQETLARKKEELSNLDDKMQLQKEMLKNFLQQAYYSQQQSLPEIVLTGMNFSDFFANADKFLTMDDKIMELMKNIEETKVQIQNDMEILGMTKQEHQKILDEKKNQRQDLVATQADTQENLADQQKVIDKLKKELFQLQGDLNTLLGKSYSAKNIMDAVAFASDKTGVPKGFLIGVLKMETNLGANVGGCTYGQVEAGALASYKAKKLGPKAWATFQARRNTFKSICKELDLDYTKQKVSCNPKGYTGTGGAMGVAQFMPDTWVAYEDQVSAKTGSKPPSPWDLTDGVMAMALKLGKVPGVTAGKTSAFKTAACAYLGTCYAPYINGILYWAANYKSLL